MVAALDSDAKIDIAEAVIYITQFVEFVDVAVTVNGSLVSGRELRSVLPSENYRWRESAQAVDLEDFAISDLEVLGLASGEVRIVLDNVRTLPDEGDRVGRAVLLQGESALRTLRSGFGLATVSAASQYRFGGVIDLPALQPTAGREALEDTQHVTQPPLVGDRRCGLAVRGQSPRDVREQRAAELDQATRSVRCVWPSYGPCSSREVTSAGR